MVVGPRMVVEEVNEHFVITDPAACDEWILKVWVSHRISVNVKLLIDVQLVALDLGRRPRNLVERSKLKQAIVKVDHSKLGTF